jgi:hypothetical protein
MQDYINILRKQLSQLEKRQRLLSELYDLKLDRLSTEDIQKLSELQDQYILDRDECEANIEAVKEELRRLELALNSENN